MNDAPLPTRPDDNLDRWAVVGPGGEAILLSKTGGRTYDWFSVKNCKTCQARPYRNEIERAILRGIPYTTIYQDIKVKAEEKAERTGQKIEDIPNNRNMAEHYKRGHMPSKESGYRRIQESRAQELGIDVDTFDGVLADHIAVARLGLQMGLENMMEGLISPSMDQTISWANFLHKVEKEGGTEYDQEAMMSAFIVYFEAVIEHCSQEQVRAISESISANPLMKSLMSQNAGHRVDDSGDPYGALGY